MRAIRKDIEIRDGDDQLLGVINDENRFVASDFNVCLTKEAIEFILEQMGDDPVVDLKKESEVKPVVHRRRRTKELIGIIARINHHIDDGMKQIEVAHACRLHQSVVSAVLIGRSTNPHQETIDALLFGLQQIEG